MRLVGMHEILPHISEDDSYKMHEIIINFDNVLYFKPTMDGKYTSIGFANGNILVREKYEDIVATFGD